MIPLVTAFIAAVVAFIAFLQWQTAREKVLLDLFDKRFAVYEELRAAVGQRHDQAAYFDFLRAALRARFLFGPKVQTFLDERRDDLAHEPVELNLLSQPIPEDRKDAAEAKLIDRADRLSRFYIDLDELVAPYMNHHQKALRQSLVEVARSAIVRR